MFEPSLFTLYLKTYYLLLFYSVLGFALNPSLIFRNFLGNLIFWQVSGITFAFYLGFLFSKINFPVRSIPFIGIGVILFRFLYLLYLRKSSSERYFQIVGTLLQSLTKKKILVYLGVTTLLVSIYFAPFIKLNTTGFYAYGGGDHTSYFGVSEYLLDHKMNELYTGNLENDEGTIKAPFENYAVRSLVYFLVRGLQWVYAPQILATAALSLAPAFPEETYTAFIGVILSILSWSVSFFVLLLTKIPVSLRLQSIVAIVSMFSSGGFSLALKHAIPSLFGWTISINILIIFVYSFQRKGLRINLNPIMLGLLVFGSVFLYFPSLLINGLLLFLLFIILAYRDFKFWLKNILIALIAFLLLGNIELERPFRLVFANATDPRVLLDYGVKWSMVFFSTFGVLDFESLLTSIIGSDQIYLYVVTVIFLGIVLLLFFPPVQSKLILIFLFPGILSIYIYMERGGHYHVIRISEFLGTILPTFAFLGFYYIAKFPRPRKYKIFLLPLLVFVSLFFYSAGLNKKQILTKLLNVEETSRAALKDSRSLVLVKEVETYAKSLLNGKEHPVGYWMHWGNVGSANNFIILRNIRFFESSEYDYQGSSIDILQSKYLNNAFFIYPPSIFSDILVLKDKFATNSAQFISGHKIQSVQKGNGAALIGTGWVPSSRNLHTKKIIRTLRATHDAGLVIWSQSEDYAKVFLRYRNNFPEKTGLLSIRYGDGIKKIYEEQTEKQKEGEGSSLYLNYLTYWIKLFNGNKIPSGMEPNLLQNLSEKSGFKERENEMKSIFSRYEFRIPIKDSGTQDFEFVVKLKKGANVIRFLPLSLTGSIRHNFGGEYRFLNPNNESIPEIDFEEMEISSYSGIIKDKKMKLIPFLRKMD